jgi:hypothetical protein
VILQLTDLTFQVKAKPEGLHVDLENSLPITIGTVPLWQGTFAAPQQIMPAPSAPPADIGMNFDPSFPYPDMRKFLAPVI